MLYHDDHCLLDVRPIILLAKIDGEGSRDGLYVLEVHMAVGEELVEAFIEYTSSEARDAAFQSIRALRLALGGIEQDETV